uniref:Uncharacterized protein n=1 Tax=Amphimedon queenslandica TaxID=400682 RepID=A0A1X7UPD8_AMPQE
MQKLLSDTITFVSCLEPFEGNPASQRPARPCLRVISSITPYLYCFTTYNAMRTPNHNARHLLAYARLLFKESLKHPGNAWMEYDRAFQQLAAIDTSTPQNIIHSDIEAATTLG